MTSQLSTPYECIRSELQRLVDEGTTENHVIARARLYWKPPLSKDFQLLCKITPMLSFADSGLAEEESDEMEETEISVAMDWFNDDELEKWISVKVRYEFEIDALDKEGQIEQNAQVTGKGFVVNCGCDQSKELDRNCMRFCWEGGREYRSEKRERIGDAMRRARGKLAQIERYYAVEKKADPGNAQDYDRKLACDKKRFLFWEDFDDGDGFRAESVKAETEAVIIADTDNDPIEDAHSEFSQSVSFRGPTPSNSPKPKAPLSPPPHPSNVPRLETPGFTPPRVRSRNTTPGLVSPSKVRFKKPVSTNITASLPFTEDDGANSERSTSNRLPEPRASRIEMQHARKQQVPSTLATAIEGSASPASTRYSEISSLRSTPRKSQGPGSVTPVPSQAQSLPHTSRPSSERPSSDSLSIEPWGLIKRELVSRESTPIAPSSNTVLRKSNSPSPTTAASMPSTGEVPLSSLPVTGISTTPVRTPDPSSFHELLAYSADQNLDSSIPILGDGAEKASLLQGSTTPFDSPEPQVIRSLFPRTSWEVMLATAQPLPLASGEAAVTQLPATSTGIPDPCSGHDVLPCLEAPATSSSSNEPSTVRIGLVPNLNVPGASNVSNRRPFFSEAFFRLRDDNRASTIDYAQIASNQAASCSSTSSWAPVGGSLLSPASNSTQASPVTKPAGSESVIRKEKRDRNRKRQRSDSLDPTVELAKRFRTSLSVEGQASVRSTHCHCGSVVRPEAQDRVSQLDELIWELAPQHSNSRPSNRDLITQQAFVSLNGCQCKKTVLYQEWNLSKNNPSLQYWYNVEGIDLRMVVEKARRNIEKYKAALPVQGCQVHEGKA
ncbi:hypothetical protein BJ508DRAFT_2361 [Ascobolus immersus RN42]|uniref:Uncharacterized protein n=1 Tax=Ascobolus immersus RN42 TaxID=1160509 RepID=A0A3N4IQ66_ASCIM|nr:hypothetical protein BJ508DRAFT_2361 [Ascobolus immersus RN42]